MGYAAYAEDQIDVTDISYDLRQLAGISAEEVKEILDGMFETGRFENYLTEEEY